MSVKGGRIAILCPRQLPELRDGVSVLTVHKAGLRGGISSVGKSGHIRLVERRAKMEGHEMEDHVRRRRK